MIRSYLFISIQALYDYKARELIDSGYAKSISIQALYDYKHPISSRADIILLFQFKHCTIISNVQQQLSLPIPVFQFKHCTIISYISPHSSSFNRISIQALYDYKLYFLSSWYSSIILFQFKHCTIIRSESFICILLFDISIQALYDYKVDSTRNFSCL